MIDAPLQHRGHCGTQRGTEYVYPELTGKIIGCAMRVHTALGPGLLEGVYEECLCSELSDSRLSFERQLSVPIRYGQKTLSTSLRLDLLVEGIVIVEVKSVEQLLSVHEAQLLTYLRLSQRRLGLLLNFNVRHLRDGIRRKVL